MNQKLNRPSPAARRRSAEVDRLVKEFSLRESPELEDKIVRSQRLEALGRLSGEVAHDFNNLLTVILGNAQAMLEGLSPSVEARALSEVVQAARRSQELTQQLLSLSRNRPQGEQLIDLNDQIRELKPLLKRMMGRQVDLIVDYRSSFRVRVEPTLIQQVLLNLAVNAGDAMPHGGSFTLETEDLELSPETTLDLNHDISPGRYVLLIVQDTGVGMSPEVLENAFEPFFSTKPESQNTGLGLATVQGMVQRSGGHVSVQSKLGAGTTFHVFIPAANKADIHDLQTDPELLDAK